MSEGVTRTRLKTNDELLSRPGRFTSFWRGVFLKADEEKASDIHIESLQEGLRVRIRIDGCLKEIEFVDQGPSLVEYIRFIKEISRLDISTRIVRQDDSFDLKLTNSKYRISLSPGYGYGECLVLRVIRNEDIPCLSALNLSKEAEEDFRWASKQKKGLILVTGPTGSGKSTTLHSQINGLDRESLKVITAEDPVERTISGVVHQSITESFGWNDAIKHCLRADPDVILVGEMRDEESAHLAIEAAQTGHLVMSTLHTNSVPDTIDRLLTLGIKNYEVADCLLLVSAQRLEKKLCDSCKIRKGNYFTANPKGCERCIKGFKGRFPLVEYIVNPNPDHILNFNKDALKANLNQSFEGEVRKAVSDGIIDCELLEAIEKKNVSLTV